MVRVGLLVNLSDKARIGLALATSEFREGLQPFAQKVSVSDAFYPHLLRHDTRRQWSRAWQYSL
jgi:hypothetical protein